MFDEREIKAYKSISAPDELYEKIMSSKPKENNLILLPTVRVLSVAAASLILVFAILYFIKAPSLKISIDGQKLDDTITVSASFEQPMMRALPISAPLSNLDMVIDAKNKTKVTVTHGCIVVSDKEGVTEITLDEPTEISWVFPSGETDNSEMRLVGKNTTTIITLTYDEANNTIIATKNTK